MNYKTIHDKFINYFRSTPPRDRIMKRNPTDQRLAMVSLYQEVHHIIPRSLGGKDLLDNIVEVLPEEHIFLHMLRYKIYKKREDALAVRFTLNGYNSKNKFKGSYAPILNKKIRMGYAWLKQHTWSVRLSLGWQTKEGRDRISAARKGTVVVRDAKTKKIIGSVSNTHPKFVSGEWVHHTKGRKISAEEREMRKKMGGGYNNNNYSGLTDEYFINKGAEIALTEGRILSWREMIILAEKLKFKWIKGVVKSRFNNQGKGGYYRNIEIITGYKYLRKLKSFKLE